jgi:2,4-dienoyl-CoA reductase-like NADH-dependent reductase (Old Yellow Enzyme family)
VPNALIVRYYAEHASAGLILSEATSVLPHAYCDGARNAKEAVRFVLLDACRAIVTQCAV